ncbi:Major Facilitator Superfamily protein [Legionella quinlivanii]|uniref:Major Facilitator Superfamily protein n=1 Tax=Legionella quinlivanii TaxID=45073 RepID=A0A0W0Y6T2_9GAMM|nr:MFS transporter [Legionella quinlivanii]KTD52652.1 Major Facilitator Superfamily protein [Legionella quinlivanii]SEG25440.1 maltose/moltooligosaccharide transporter [Legionella quinlivanii DSM 21216]STY10332.1 sucrose/H+ symporter [Legionella quinlivanii]
MLQMKRTFLYLALLSFSINFGFTFQLSNLSALFKISGANDFILPLLWLIPPLTGVFIQPLIGYISDKSITKIGRRKPYILVWGLVGAFSFCLLPLQSSLFNIVLFTFFIDCSLNGSAEGLRALTADSFQEDKTRMQAFSAEAFFAGLGGVLGAFLPIAVHKIIAVESSDFVLPLNLSISYVTCGVLFIIVVLFFLRKVDEKPVNLLRLDFGLFCKLLKELAVSIKGIRQEIKKADSLFLKLLIIHSISWMGVFIFWLYFSLCIAQENYHFPYSGSSNENLHLMKAASLDSSFYFSLYQYVSLMFTMLVFIFSKYIRVETLHGLALLGGGIGVSLIGIISSSPSLIFSSICIGIMWGSLISLPYVVLSKFLPKESIGTYLGIFNMSITFPQIICALMLPPVYFYFLKSHAAYALFLGGILILISSVFWLRLFHFQPNLRRAPALLKKQEIYRKEV